MLKFNMDHPVTWNIQNKCRVEICRNRHDWRSCNIFVGCVIFFSSENKAFSYIFCKFSLTWCKLSFTCEMSDNSSLSLISIQRVLYLRQRTTGTRLVVVAKRRKMVSKGKLNEPPRDQGPDCCPPLSSSRTSRTQKVSAYFCSEDQIYFQVIA